MKQVLQKATSTVVVSFRTTRIFRHLLRAAAEADGVPVASFVERIVREELNRMDFRPGSAPGHPLVVAQRRMWQQRISRAPNCDGAGDE